MYRFYKNSTYFKKVDSTNEMLRKLMREYDLSEGFLIRTDFQTSGKGQIGNGWESEAGKNLLFSMLLYPTKVKIQEQFIISQIVSLAIKKVLDNYATGFSIKWPNDIYHNDKKIGGVLIENSIQGASLNSSIIGIGLNINQLKFESNAPNPISLRQITAKNIARIQILKAFYENFMSLYSKFDVKKIRASYLEQMYRKEGYHLYEADGSAFEAKILSVDTDGKMNLFTRKNEVRGFYFKEVKFCI